MNHLLELYEESKHKSIACRGLDAKKAPCCCHGDNTRVEYRWEKNYKAVICLAFPQPVIPSERSRLCCYTCT